MSLDIAVDVLETYNFLLSSNTAGVAFLFNPDFTTSLRPTADPLAIKYAVSSDKVIEEFRRLLAIKVFTSDGEGTKISPTSLMDKVWCAAILDTRLYPDLQAALGVTLHYRPPQASTVEEESTNCGYRIQALRGNYMAFFFSAPVELRTCPQIVKPARAVPVPGSIAIFVKFTSSKTVKIFTRGDETVDRVKASFVAQKGLRPEQSQLVFGNKILKDGGARLADCGINQNDTIIALYQPRPIINEPRQPDREIQIFIDFLTFYQRASGRTMVVNTSLNSTIADVKGVICSKERIPVSRQRLLYSSKELDDGNTLRYYNVSNLTTLQIRPYYQPVQSMVPPNQQT